MNERTVDAIGDFAGAAEADGYRAFCRDTRRIYDILEKPFLRAAQPSMGGLIGADGFRGLVAAAADQAVLVDVVGAWTIFLRSTTAPTVRALCHLLRILAFSGARDLDAGGACRARRRLEYRWRHARLAKRWRTGAKSFGATIRYGQEVSEVLVSCGRAGGVRLASGERIAADAVIVNADVGAVANGLFGIPARRAAAAIPRRARSLSAMTWSVVATPAGFPLRRHNVFFSGDYAAEFDDIFARDRLPREPTVYVCAQDRDDGQAIANGPEKFLVLINAPANGDRHAYDTAEVEQCAQRTFGVLERWGLQIQRQPDAMQVTTPADFNRMFPATGGALYGRSSHGWTASFQRPGVRTKIPGLYLAGGSTHPGPGVPMAALSGRWRRPACLRI